MSRPAGSRRRFRPATALAVSFALMAVLILAGCSDPATPATGTSSPSGTSAAQEGSGTTATASGSDPDETGSPTAGTATGVDQQAAASIEDSVSQAETLLKQLDQEFQQDNSETS